MAIKLKLVISNEHSFLYFHFFAVQNTGTSTVFIKRVLGCKNLNTAGWPVTSINKFAPKRKHMAMPMHILPPFHNVMPINFL